MIFSTELSSFPALNSDIASFLKSRNRHFVESFRMETHSALESEGRRETEL